MLLEATKVARIHAVKEDDFYLTLVQDGHVRITFYRSLFRVLIFSSDKAGFPNHFWGPKPGYNISRVACGTTRGVYGAGMRLTALKCVH